MSELTAEGLENLIYKVLISHYGGTYRSKEEHARQIAIDIVKVILCQPKINLETIKVPPSFSANKTQIGGDHYKSGIQHWDYVVANQLDYFQAQITKYVTRWKKKNGLQDLEKARHFLDKYIEVSGDENGSSDDAEPGPGYVNQDR